MKNLIPLKSKMFEERSEALEYSKKVVSEERKLGFVAHSHIKPNYSRLMWEVETVIEVECHD